MGCLAELVLGIVVEGFLELVGYGYMKLMTLIVPDKVFTNKTKEKIKNAVTTVSAILGVVLVIGIILLLYDDPIIKTIGKCMTYIPLWIICVQIILGIVVKIVNKPQRKQPQEVPPMPKWDEVVKMMYDKYLDAYADEVVQVFYSKDKTMRYVILKDEKGFFTYQLEAIYQFDEDEWKYISSNDDTLPAMWEPFRGMISKSIFSDTEELLREIKAEPEYKKYFEP